MVVYEINILKEIMMSWGDTLMALGEARKIHEETGKMIIMEDQHGNILRHDAWKNNPYVSVFDVQDAIRLPNRGHRGYTSGATDEKWSFKPYTPIPAEFFFDAEELTWATKATEYWVAEPTLKDRVVSVNKQWPFDHWNALGELLNENGIKIIQLAASEPSYRIPHAEMLITPTARYAAAVLKGSKGYVGHEGGMHHTAAAVGVPAVVIMGGFTVPAHTGYDLPNHRYLHGNDPCGNRLHCDHCDRIMKSITPEMVFEMMKELM